MTMFRTIEVSDSRFERDGLRHVTFKSRALAARADVTLFVPKGVTSATPVVTLLHGVYGSHWAWALKGGVHVTAARLIAAGEMPAMVIAMPSDGLWGDGSGYVRHRAHASRADYEAFVADEVPAVVGRVTGAAGAGFIAGLSMGGFGALRIGAKYGRDRYRAAAGHSSITEFKQLARFVEEPLSAYGAIGAEEQSVLETMLVHREALPAIRFVCGTEDPLIEENRALHRALVKFKVPHEYLEEAGGHEWGYWARRIEETLRWFGSLV